ncbi:enoyl-CoA hydratase/isomerase family protein [Litorimonas sp. WD9-15]|uniref:enoyl-CoA hydratase/isomerase family protein n=1 Tax=Litorimonas sp. WD9-15 TaxID=3418716 RepID=UPI003D033532
MQKLPDTTVLQLDLAEGWLTIWLDNPKSRNAINDAMCAELLAVMDSVRDDRSVRGITLRGKNDIFCSGGDLKSFNAMQAPGVTQAEVAKMNRGIGDVLLSLNEMPQVVIVLVEGAAIAGGLGLMCCGDVIVATEDAKFSLTETMIGIPPAQIAPFVVARVGLPMARRIMLTGARFTGREAVDYGLVDHVVVSLDELDEKEAEIKRGVMKCAPGAIAATKHLILSSRDKSGAEMMNHAADVFADCMLSDEGKEGITSFVEKRKPNWNKK